MEKDLTYLYIFYIWLFGFVTGHLLTILIMK